MLNALLVVNLYLKYIRPLVNILHVLLTLAS